MIPLPQLPKMVEKKDNQATFVVEGLYPGYGITLGNSLRRVLLSSLPGAAITQVRIQGVQHEFSTIPGVMEDVINICLNLKKLRFKLFSSEPQQAILKISGETEAKGKDFKLPTQLELVNEDQNIATLTDKKATLEMEITVQKGVGYEPREMRSKEKLDIGQISLDAIYSPVQRVIFRVEDMRVGERTDFDRLFIEIVTDGTMSPEEALVRASEILIDHFSLISNQKREWLKETTKGLIRETDNVRKPKDKQKKKAKKDEKDGSQKEKSIEEIGLSTRTINALNNARIKTVAGLLKKTEEDLLKLEGIGEKGLKEIKKALKKLDCELKK